MAKTLRLTYDALKKRLDGSDRRGERGWAYHDGVPNAQALPNDEVGVWLNWVGLAADPQTTFRSDYFKANWNVHIVIRDTGGDVHGFEITKGMQVLGDIIQMTHETLADISLDSSVDSIESEAATSDIGGLSAGDRQIQQITYSFVANHPMTYFRTT